MKFPALGLVVLVMLYLGGCSTAPVEEADGRPLRMISAEQVEPAQPRPEILLAAGNTSPYEVLGRTYSVLASSEGYRESGRASWYGRKFHGRRTANGEIFDAYLATAAHRSLPIPCYVRVTNLDNGKSLVVRVNDRGPFHEDRIIDLSYGAAVKLGIADQGTAPVELVALSVDGTQDLRGSGWTGGYRFLQVASFREAGSAREMQRELREQVDTPVAVSEVSVAGNTHYRVKLGPVNDRHALQSLRSELAGLGYGLGTPVEH